MAPSAWEFFLFNFVGLALCFAMLPTKLPTAPLLHCGFPPISPVSHAASSGWKRLIPGWTVELTSSKSDWTNSSIAASRCPEHRGPPQWEILQGWVVKIVETPSRQIHHLWIQFGPIREMALLAKGSLSRSTPIRLLLPMPLMPGIDG